MAYRLEGKEIIIDGWEKGIAPSPYLGIGDLKCGNIATVPEEVEVNFSRFQNSELYSSSTSGTLTPAGSGGLLINYTIVSDPTNINYLLTGSWITVSNSTISGLSNGNYFISVSSNVSYQIILNTQYVTNGSSTLTIGSTGSATFTFVANTATAGGILSTPVAGATEVYYDSSQNVQYRYYLMDINGLVWVYDTAVLSAGGTNYWALITTVTARDVVYGGGSTEPATGMAVYNGFLIVFIGELICYKLTAMLGVNPNTPSSIGWATSSYFGAYGQNPSTTLNQLRGSKNPHYTYNSKGGALYWTDGSFVGSLFATANTGGNPNVFSYAKVTASNSSGLLFTINDLIGGAIPEVGMPITFYSSNTLPTGISADNIYYVLAPGLVSTSLTFQVSATKGGSPIAYTDAGVGNLYYNTLDLNLKTTFIFSPQALTLPQESDITQCITEIGNNLLIGCNSNTLYFWDGVSITPNGFLFLPEANAVQMITANNMAFIFAGNRGNIYISNGNTSSIVTTVPDYITGRPDPYFIWGGVMYARGRIWFSIQDQTASITGNCGGIWSFVPTQNFYPGQDTGLSLHLEHQNSYGNYNGVANVLINEVTQTYQGIQYFSAWTSSVSSPTYGIDASSSTPYTGGQTLIETDLVPIGNYIDKGNFVSLVTKYSAPLVSGESVKIYYRNNISSTFQSFTDPTTGTDSTVGSLGTRFDIPFAQQTMVQFRIILTSTATNPSYTRLRELRIRK